MKSDWEEFRTEKEGYPQTIEICREDVESIMDEEITDREWWEIHNTILDKINDVMLGDY